MSIWSSIWNGAKGVLGAIGGPLISGGLSFLGSLAGARSQRNAQRSANEANMRLAQYSYDKNLEMWHLQNQYNSPSAQMQRAKEAGLNPNLIYGQGNMGNSTSIPRYDAPTIASDQGINYGQAIGNAIGAYQNVAMNLAQMNLMSRQGSKLGSDAEYAKVRAYIAGREWDIKQPFMNDYWRLKNDNLQQDVNNKVIQAGYLADLANLTSQKYRNLQLEYSMLRDKKDIYARMLKQQLENMKAQHTVLMRQENAIYNRSMVDFYEQQWRATHSETWRLQGGPFGLLSVPQLWDSFKNRFIN